MLTAYKASHPLRETKIHKTPQHGKQSAIKKFFQAEGSLNKFLPAISSGSHYGYQTSQLINILIGNIGKLDAANFREATKP